MAALNVNVLFNGDWLEETPLGRAEWIKLFGALFDQSKKADSLFQKIESNYLTAKKLALEAKESPTVLTGALFQDKWNLPAGESFMATFFKDANTSYFWKDSPGTGSLVMGLESVLDVAGNADLWLGSGIFTNYEEMGNSNSHYSSFNPFQKKKGVHFFKKERK
ncbi:MAG: ABC transporter substrate-binding protein [Flavobacteriaceae bacterium]|nr:ABC transporter substrate-binding protein [Flavobacteriaceae bacterium]